MKNLQKYVKEGRAKYPDNTEMSAMYANVKFGIESEAEVAKLIGDTPVKKIKINNLDEIKSIVKDLDV